MKGTSQHITILILTALLSIAAGNALAQVTRPVPAITPVNTGDDPYLGTTHRYVVTVDDWDKNNQIWTLVYQTTTDTTTYSLSESFLDTDTDGNLYYIDITFDRNVFEGLLGTWILRYEEISNDDGSCVATREFDIHLQENEFYESLYDIASETPPNSTPACHDLSNTVQVYADVSGLEFETSYNFPVYMHKESDFKLGTWQFDAEVDATGYTITNIGKGSETTDQGADYTITESGGVYTIVADSIGEGDYESDIVWLNVVVEGPMFTDFDMELDISNGYAISGSTGQVVTEDNVHIYPTETSPEADEWRTKSVTIQGVPETHDIAEASSETEWSAQNPLQYSTHNYTVHMGDVSNNDAAWHILDSDSVAVPEANYVLTPGSSSTNSNAEFTFNMEPGDYTIVFTEENDNGCISVRHYPITLGGPFVVSIAEVGDQCATASGNIYESLQPTDTEITYTVTLETSYLADWDFGFDIISSTGFASPDLEVTNVSVTSGASYDSDTGVVSVSNSEASPLTEVEITVTYNGRYENEHTITAGVNNPSGSFNEQATDVSEEHTIYAMPQAGTLAGVD